ncbi:MAG: tetratricopeptide repeat protein [Pseudomonadota bacterium]
MLTRLYSPGSVLLLLAAVLFTLAHPAQAAWHKAETDRFIIYSDSRAEDLADFGDKLERFHQAMEQETGRQLPVPSPSNRLTIYMVGSLDDLRRVYGRRNTSVGGFYIPRANGSVTFVPNINLRTQARVRTGTRARRSAAAPAIDFSFQTVLHEYAHHFLISSTPFGMPRWLSEGSAEYFSSARFNDDGSVDIGLPNNNRAFEISQAAPVSVEALVDYEVYRKQRGGRYDAFYGRSWLLYHYLRFNAERSGQLPQYWQAVASGTKSKEAAPIIFGDLDRLEKELKSYGRQKRMAGFRIPASAFQIGNISVDRLESGHAEMMDVIIRSKRGVSRAEALELIEKARAVAQRYPGDADVQAALAEAEYDAGFDDKAIEAADRAIAIDPTTKNAFVQKGYALFRRAQEAEVPDQEAAYAAAMKPFEDLNALEADHTQPLVYYYRSYAERGLEVPENAKFALERALQLAPFDNDLAMNVAAMRARDGDTVVSGYILGPVAANPHGGRQARIAQAMIEYLERAPEGLPADLGKVRQAFEAAEEQAQSSGG